MHFDWSAAHCQIKISQDTFQMAALVFQAVHSIYSQCRLAFCCAWYHCIVAWQQTPRFAYELFYALQGFVLQFTHWILASSYIYKPGKLVSLDNIVIVLRSKLTIAHACC